MFNFDAIVLAAGRGVRLRPMTATLPKVMAIVEMRPLLAWQIDLLRADGLNPIVTAWWKSKPIRELAEEMNFGVCVENELKPPSQIINELYDAEMLNDVTVVINGDTILPDRPIKLMRRLQNLPDKYVASIMARPWTQIDTDTVGFWPHGGNWFFGQFKPIIQSGAHIWTGAMAIRPKYLLASESDNLIEALPSGAKIDVMRVMDREHNIDTWNQYRLAPRYIKRYYQLALEQA